MATKKAKKTKVKKDKGVQPESRIIPPRPADAPEGSYFDEEDWVWKDKDGNQIGPG